MSENSKNIDYVGLAIKYLSGEAEEHERHLLERWMERDESNRKVFESYKKTWDKVEIANDFTTESINKEWEKLEQEIGIIDEKGTGGKIGWLSKGFVRIAASLVFFLAAIAVVYFYLPEIRSHKVASEDASASVELEDGSAVTLNAFSTLKYSPKYGKEERRVSLNGEAFFEVERDEETPFIIEVFDAQVKVLGTSFNISAYEDSTFIQVVVRSGIVEFSTADTALVLHAGDKGVYNTADQTIQLMSNDDVNYLAWKTRTLIFDNLELREIVNIVNKVYRANIRIGDEGIGGCTLSTTFEGQSLEAILEVIESTLDIDSEKQNGEILLKGEGC